MKNFVFFGSWVFLIQCLKFFLIHPFLIWNNGHHNKQGGSRIYVRIKFSCTVLMKFKVCWQKITLLIYYVVTYFVGSINDRKEKYIKIIQKGQKPKCNLLRFKTPFLYVLTGLFHKLYENAILITFYFSDKSDSDSEGQ